MFTMLKSKRKSHSSIDIFMIDHKVKFITNFEQVADTIMSYWLYNSNAQQNRVHELVHLLYCI